MFTIPNMISLCRIPLAIIFLKGSTLYRAVSIVIAMLTDGLDGYYARRFKQRSSFGTLLDPITDKLFVFTVLAVLIGEERITWMETAIFISRDFSVFLFGIYLIISRQLFRYQFRAIWCGKVTTVLQFSTLFALTLNIPIPSYLYSIFIILGVLALAELYYVDHTTRRITQ